MYSMPCSPVIAARAPLPPGGMRRECIRCPARTRPYRPHYRCQCLVRGPGVGQGAIGRHRDKRVELGPEAFDAAEEMQRQVEAGELPGAEAGGEFRNGQCVHGSFTAKRLEKVPGFTVPARNRATAPGNGTITVAASLDDLGHEVKAGGNARRVLLELLALIGL